MIGFRKYFIQEHLHRKVNDGGIGNADAEKILLVNGWKPVFFPAHYDFSLFGKLRRIFYLIQMMLSIPRASFVLFQFPLYARLNKILIRRLLKKQINVICFITDIDGLKDGNESLLKREIKELKKFSYFIVHNVAMENWLSLQVHYEKAMKIEFFDFLTPPFSGTRQMSNQIVFAGNLSKSLFLEHLHDVRNVHRLHFNLYGPGVSKRMEDQEFCSYKGVYSPYEMPAVVEGSFGLVWDGNSISEKGGSFYDYMQYISHHKLSLYILSGLPVIIYEKAGAAELVSKYKIGILIKDLNDIADEIDKVTETDYAEMRLNMKKIAACISSGSCLKNALKSIIEKAAEMRA